MTQQEIIQHIMVFICVFAIGSIYEMTKRRWYVRFNKTGDGHYNDEPVYIHAHTFEGAKRKAKRMCRKNNWEGFKLRTY
jgi:hypothetical protein